MRNFETLLVIWPDSHAPSCEVGSVYLLGSQSSWLVIPHYLENKRRRRKRRIQSTDSFEVQKLKSEPAHKGGRKDEKKSEDVRGGKRHRV